MSSKAHDHVMLTTPRGHEVRAVLDYERFEVRQAKVVNNHTGVIKPLDPVTTQTLARALQAKKVYDHAVAETQVVEETLKRFGSAAIALGDKHPALAPYLTEAKQHRSIAEDMRERARVFHDEAMIAIDKLAGD
jgi:hypothetical protein